MSTQHPGDPHPEAFASPLPAQMGWYIVPGSTEARWWDGRNWTAYRIRPTGPKPDWFATEPPLIGFALGPLFMLLGVLQFTLRSSAFDSFTSTGRFSGTLFVLLGGFWLIMATAMALVRAKPRPAAVQLLSPMVEPLPGRVEGPRAGWIALSPRVSRWWSGARWAEYVFENKKVRPTYGGRRAYRRSQLLSLVLLGIGALSTIIAVFVLPGAVGHTARWFGIYLTGFGVTLLVLSGLILLILYARRHSFLLPKTAPQVFVPVESGSGLPR